MKKLIARLQLAIHSFINPPTWASITDEERSALLSLSVKQRRKLAKAVVASQVLDVKFLNNAHPNAGGQDSPLGGADPGDAGIVMGNVLADMRREMIREAARQGERNGK